MQFPQTREWEKIGKQAQKQREAQRVNLLKTDANPNPDYKLPHHLLLTRAAKGK